MDNGLSTNEKIIYGDDLTIDDVSLLTLDQCFHLILFWGHLLGSAGQVQVLVVWYLNLPHGTKTVPIGGSTRTVLRRR